MSTSRTERRRHVGDQAGFMLVEVLVATLVIAVGVVGLLSGFVASQKLSLVSERESTMSHVAQREIERVEGLAYSSIGLCATPATSTNTQNPGYYVSASNSPVNGCAPNKTSSTDTTSTFAWNRSASPAENLDIDPSAGQVTPTQTWSEGTLSGTLYDYITWANDGNCGSGCPSSKNYKRITVVVTMAGSVSPSPVWVSSVIADPNAAPTTSNPPVLNGNPLTSGATTCAKVSGSVTSTVACESPIDSGTANTFFLHDCAAGSGACSTPLVNNPLHATVGAVNSLLCSTVVPQLLINLLTSGCPTPDEMDPTPPTTTGTSTIPSYSSDQGTSGYPGGRLLQPICPLSGSNCGGTGSTNDCNSALSWTSSLLNLQNEMWVTAPLSTDTTLTGEGALNLFTQTQNGTNSVVTLCIELYEIPPSKGILGSLADILAYPPVALGGAGYVAATDPVTHANWPTAPSNVEFAFKYAASAPTVPAGDRIGVRVWVVANLNNAIALLYDNPNYPSEIQLNSSGSASISTSGS